MAKDSEIKATVASKLGERESVESRVEADHEIGEFFPALTEADETYWNSRPPEERVEYLKQLDAIYKALLNEFLTSANLCVRMHRKLARRHRFWRIGLITITGGLAILNLLAALSPSPDPLWWSKNILIISAAIYAAILTLFSNLENFNNFLERSQAFRESREIYLTAYREFERRWHVYVRPFGDGAEACVNATVLYREVVERDESLRSKFKEITETKN